MSAEQAEAIFFVNMSSNDTLYVTLVASGNRTLPPEANIEIYQPNSLLVVLLSLCYGLVSLVAVFGNFLVLWIVATSRRMQTITNFFIANLAVADVIIGMFSIPFQFQAALLQYWGLPEFMCPLCPFVQVLSVNVSISSMTAIALERYRAIMHPLKAKTTKFRSKVIIGCIWLVSGAAGVPILMTLRVTLIYDPASGNYTRPFCKSVGLFQPMTWGVYNHALVGVQYLLPLGVITFAYGRLGLRLRDKAPGNSQEARDATLLRNKRRVIKMLMIVVALFAFCWLPYQAYNILRDIFPKINEYKYINVIWFSAHWLAMSNSCYNPFVYAIYNKHFQKALRDRFRMTRRLTLLRLHDLETNTGQRPMKVRHPVVAS